MEKRIRKFLKTLRFYTILIIVAIVLAVTFRVFVFAQIIKVSSWSMEPTVIGGDKIIVTKLIPGPRIYKDIRQIRVDGKVQTKRFMGIRKVRRDDILIFNFPYSAGWDKIDMNLNVFYLKRCVALPGDTFSIENGIYKINDNPNSSDYTHRQREISLKSQDDFACDIWNCFPFDSVHYQWNIKNFGPLYVPASGDSLSVDTLNIVLYKNLIEYETNKALAVHNGLIYLGEDKINTYTFRLNYYFMAGDNIFDSQDSRYFGLLPEDCIIGKALFVWQSTDMQSGKKRWDRFFKTIN